MNNWKRNCFGVLSSVSSLYLPIPPSNISENIRCLHDELRISTFIFSIFFFSLSLHCLSFFNIFFLAYFHPFSLPSGHHRQSSKYRLVGSPDSTVFCLESSEQIIWWTTKWGRAWGLHPLHHIHKYNCFLSVQLRRLIVCIDLDPSHAPRSCVKIGIRSSG